MTKCRFLLSTAMGAVAAISVSAPAMAQDSANSDDQVATEAVGDFAGFTASPTIVSLAVDNLEVDFEQAVIARTSRGFSGINVTPDPEILVRDDVTLFGSIDFADTLPSAVQILLFDNVNGGAFFNCTGTLINPRTVLTAAHCVNDNSSEAYGLPGDAPLTLGISTGVDTLERYLNGVGYAEGGFTLSTDVIIHPSSNLDNGGLPFPWADIALIALDDPITDIPSAPILLTPLDELTHVLQVGYGTFGTGDNGEQGIGFLRLVGENMLGAITSNAGLIDQVIPFFAPSAFTLGIDTQTMYFTDFDNPNRTPEQEANCGIIGGGLSCADIDAVRALDFFDGDALPNEVGTAPGDSGSGLFADEIYDVPVVIGVLSGGWDFFGIGNQYSDISFYNPLFPFFEFISENTPYKYVSNLPGDAVWSDPGHWTQDLDPGFLIDDGSGNLVNGLPDGPEPGVYSSDINIGSILGVDISATDPGASPFLPPEGTPGFGGNLPESSVLLGPGSTGFVPNNTDGTPGVAFDDPALYFDVLLLAPGTTTVNIDVEIDRLTIDGPDTVFDLLPGKEFTSIQGVEQYRGTSIIDGQLNGEFIVLFGGQMGGRGTIDTRVMFNVAGGLFVGGWDRIGTMTINGDFVNTSGGIVVVDVKRSRGNGSDLLDVNGFAVLDGLLAVSNPTSSDLRFGDTYTVLEAQQVIGQFGAVASLIDSPVLYFEQIVNDTSVQLEVMAHSIEELVGADSSLASLGKTLDALRFGGQYNNFASLFGVVDGAGFSQFGSTLVGLTPTSGFAQSATSINFARRFSGQIAQRTLRLRGADKAAAAFSGFGSASFAQAGDAPDAENRLGFFGSVSGSFLVNGNERNTGAKAFEEATFTQAGELTIGADVQLSENFSLGMAVSNIRDGASGTSTLQPVANESIATAAYAALSFGKGFADLYFGHADQRFGLERGGQGLLADEFRSAVGVADGEQTMAGIRTGYAFNPAKGLNIGPVASLDYVRSELEGFREFQAGDFGLNVHSRSLTSIGAKAGLMATADLKLGRNSSLKAFGSAAYARELGDSEDVVTANFIGAEGLPFSIARQLDGDWVSLNAGAEVQLGRNFSTQLSVTSDVGRGMLSDDQGKVTMNWRF